MKGKKLIVSALVATMVGAPVAVLNNSAASVLAEENTNTDELYTVVGPSVKVSKDYDKSAKQHQAGVRIPEIVLESGASGIITDLRIIDPTGTDITTKKILDDGVFTPTKVGVYTYRITCFEGTKTGAGEDEVITQTSIASTYELTLEVTGDSGSIEIPENSYYVIPTEFVKGKTLTVPVPTTFLNDDDIDFTSGVNANSDNGGNRFEKVLDNGTTDVTSDDSTITLKAFLVKSGQDDIEMLVNNETGSAYDKQAYFSYTFADNDNVVGNYKLVYKLYNNGNVVAVSNAKTIKVRSSLTSDKLYISWANTPKKSANVGSKYSLVDVNATFVENSTDYVNAFTQITVTHQATGEEMEVNYEDMTFIPKYKGNYFVSYKALIPSLGVSSNVLPYTITNVEDEITPTIYFTDSYLIESEGENKGRPYVMKNIDNDPEEEKVYLDEIEDTAELLHTVGDLSHYTKSYYRMNDQGEVTVRIPAAYVVDNYSNVGSMKITRNLYKKSQPTESGRLKLIKSEDVEYGFNEVAEFTFKLDDPNAKDGNYVIKYVATDENGMTTSSDQNITIKAATDKNVVGEPTLDFNYDEEMVDANEVVTFDIPTATDSYETNLLVKTYYSFVEPTVSENVLNTTNLVELNYENINDKGDYELDMKTILNGQSHQYLYLISTAHNNYDVKLTEGKNYIVKKILILGARVDNDAPVYENKFFNLDDDEITFNEALVDVNEGDASTITLTNSGYVDEAKKVALFDQDDVIKIPTVKFTDADSVVNFDIKVTYESNGEIVELNSLGYSLTCEKVSGQELYEHTLSGASFKANYAKTYTITIVATDSNGNVSFVSYAVRVNDTQPPVIIVPNRSKFSSDVEIGTKFAVPAPQIIDNDEVKEASTWSYTLTTPEGNVYNMPSTKRTLDYEYLNQTGTYIITYTAADGSGNDNTSSEYTLNVVAKDAPVITLDGFIDEIDQIGWDYTTNATQQTRYLPKASAKDVNFNKAIYVDAPTVKNSKGEEVDVTDEGDSWGFVPNTQGTYTITYSAQGEFLNSTKQYTMVIGDGEAPTLDWVNKSEDLKTTVNKGDKWAFKFDMVKFDDNEDEIQKSIDEILSSGVNSTNVGKLSDYMTIKMKNPDNETVNYTIADNALNYTFEEAGSYTFTITLKDKAGNSTGNTYSYTITVNEEEATEESKKSNDSVVGTVLIVLSVVILAGVVAYFAITTKQVDSKSKNKKAKKDNKKDKE